MIHNYTNEDLAREYFSIATQVVDNSGGISRCRKVSERIKDCSYELRGHLSRQGDLQSLKEFGSETKHILELILTEGEKARDIFYEEEIRKYPSRTEGAYRLSGGWKQMSDGDESDNPSLQDGVRILEDG